MGRIFGLGETVLDIIFKDNQPVATRSGGSAFNALVSLARAGLAYGINEQKPAAGDIDRWKTIVEKAVEFSTNVCLSFDNYISREFAATL